MAKPTYYPDWATQTVTLPGTGNTNKIRPKETIRNVGMDFGQIMTCEEMNWILNNLGLWVHYIVDEFFPTLPKTYLPLVGTKITMAGDATGNVTWNGNKEVTLSIQVVDNSHNHLSANITDATSSTVTPNVLVKRDGNGGIYAGDTYVCGTSASDAATIFFRNFAGQTITNISSTPTSGGSFSITRLNPTNGASTASIYLYDAGYVQLTSPRSANGQDTTNGNALVRLDYLNSRLSSLQTTLQNNINTVQNNLNNVNTNLTNSINNNVTTLNNRITSVQTSLQNQITNNYNTANATFVRDIRLGSLGSTGRTGGESFSWRCPASSFMNGLDVKSRSGHEDELDVMYWRQIQKNVNGSWYNIGQL